MRYYPDAHMVSPVIHCSCIFSNLLWLVVIYYTVYSLCILYYIYCTCKPSYFFWYVYTYIIGNEVYFLQVFFVCQSNRNQYFPMDHLLNYMIIMMFPPGLSDSGYKVSIQYDNVISQISRVWWTTQSPYTMFPKW